MFLHPFLKYLNYLMEKEEKMSRTFIASVASEIYSNVEFSVDYIYFGFSFSCLFLDVQNNSSGCYFHNLMTSLLHSENNNCENMNFYSMNESQY